MPQLSGRRQYIFFGNKIQTLVWLVAATSPELSQIGRKTYLINIQKKYFLLGLLLLLLLLLLLALLLVVVVVFL
jgi:hypothetical protein